MLFFVFCFSTGLQVGHRLGFGAVSAVWFLSFRVSGLLAWSGQPFFFLCHRHLWSVLSFFATGICGLFFLSLPEAFVVSFFSLPQAFSVYRGFFTAVSAVGIRVRLSVSALLALVSGIRVPLSCWYHAVR